MSKAYPCIYCTDDLKCTKYTDDEATSFCVLGPCKDEKPSHGDKIRVMSDEKLAEFLTTIEVKCYKRLGYESDAERFKAQWLEWLKKEADNGGVYRKRGQEFPHAIQRETEYAAGKGQLSARVESLFESNISTACRRCEACGTWGVGVES